MTVSLVWATPNGDSLLGYMARVSNPNAKEGDDASKLIRFLIDHNHWSPFEMVNMCVEIQTTRDIGRQILRHRSFSFQEFSQRYAAVDTANLPQREMRFKGSTNRQGSLDQNNESLGEYAMLQVRNMATLYNSLIEAGVAPECARSILPEGYTPTRMYMNGTVRSWIHYLQQRLDSHAQKEHRAVAEDIAAILCREFPFTYEAAFPL